MAIPSSRSGKAGDGRGYPRPRPSSSDNNFGDRPRERYEDRNNDAPPYRRPVDARPAYIPPRPLASTSVTTPTPAPVTAVSPTPVAASQFVLTDDLRELIKLVENSNLTEVTVENAGWKVQIKREKQQLVEYVTAPAMARAGHTAPPALAAAEPEVEENYHKVTAPMVGIFYRSPDPKARPFVQEGEMVEKGQTIGIIEAMKIMNEIVSEHSGRCVRLSAENGQAVEYGQTLLLLEPA